MAEGERNENHAALKEARPKERVFGVLDPEHLERAEVPDRKANPQEKIDARNRGPRVLQEDEERQGEIEHRPNQRDQFAKLHPTHAAASTCAKVSGYQWKQFA